METGRKFSYELCKNLFCILTVISLAKMGSFYQLYQETLRQKKAAFVDMRVCTEIIFININL